MDILQQYIALDKEAQQEWSLDDVDEYIHEKTRQNFSTEQFEGRQRHQFW